YDIGGGIGGPLKKDKLWFYTSHRKWGDRIQIANLFYNATPHTLFFTPDLSRPVQQWNDYRDHAGSLTWQVSRKDKVTYTIDWQDTCQCQSSAPLSGTNAIEASVGLFSDKTFVTQGTWLHPASSKLLFEGGTIVSKGAFLTRLAKGADEPLPADIAIRELSTN